MAEAAPKIAACLIVRDAADTLERCLASIRPFVDEVNVYDTGSSDATPELLDRIASEEGAPLRVELGEWRDDFAWARERSFALASDDVGWLLWIDADDELVGGETLHRLVADAPAEADGFAFLYETEHDEDGNVVAQTWRERLLRRSAGYRWQGAVHEALAPPDGRRAVLVPVRPERIRVVHRRAPERWTPGRNLLILLAERERRAAAGLEPDPRITLYLGTESMWQGSFEAAVPYLQAYLESQADDWPDEAADAAHRLALCLRLSGRPDEAAQVELDAFARRGDWSDLALGLAETYGQLERWEEAAEWARRALALGVPETRTTQTPLRLRAMPALRLVEAGLALGRDDIVSEGIAALDVEGLESSAAELRAHVEAGRPEHVGSALRSMIARHDVGFQAFVRGLRLQGERRLAGEAAEEPGVIQELERLKRRFPELVGIEALLSEARAGLASAYADYLRTVSTADAAASLELAALLLALCEALRPRSILDLGSGFTSYVFRRYAAQCVDPPRVVSVDDSAEWAERTREFLVRHRVSEEDLVLLDDYGRRPHEVFDLVVHDLGLMPVRAATLRGALRRVAPRGLLVLDDVHMHDYRELVLATLADAGWRTYDLRGLTLDEFGRFSMLAERDADGDGTAA